MTTRSGQQGGAPEEKQGAVKFHNQLSKWQARRLEKVRMTEDHERRLAEMRVALEEKRRKADEITKTFRSFVAEVAKGSESSRSGQGIAQREVRAYFAKLAEKDEELQKVRLKAVQLRSRFDRAEATMRSKEQLAPGLHLIDFEQLKIENQSLNEKIEERNEELRCAVNACRSIASCPLRAALCSAVSVV